MRYLIDEAALPRLVSHDSLGTPLSAFATTILDLQRDGEIVGITAGWATTIVDGTDLGEFLSHVPPHHRDTALLTMRALDRCTVWDSSPDLDVDPEIAVDETMWESFGVAHAASLAAAGRVAGCITVLGCHTAGRRRVRRRSEQPVDVVFVVETSDVRHVHRLRFSVENLPEGKFFEVAEKAFPSLAFAEGVTFQRFDGKYRDLRDQVVAHLEALDDHFRRIHEAAAGDLKIVSAELGIAMSIEGEIRNSPRLMRMRDVRYKGQTYRCEIHSKIEPHRNRIHFHPGDENSGRRIVIGIFVDHLRT